MRALLAIALMLLAVLAFEAAATRVDAGCADECCACDDGPDCCDAAGPCACASHATADLPRLAVGRERLDLPSRDAPPCAARTWTPEPRGPPPTPPPIG